MLKKLTNDNFHIVVRDSDDIFVVFFTVEGNTVCENFKPEVEQMAQAMKGDVQFVEVDLDSNEEIEEEYNVSSVPALMLFSGGMIVDVLYGSHKRNEIRMWIAENT